MQPAASVLGLGTVVPAVSATPQERQLLTEYGKVMYYKLEFGWSPTNYVDAVYVLALEADPFADPNWSQPAFGSDTFGGLLYYHAASMEIVVDAPNLFPANTNVKPAGAPFDLPNMGVNDIVVKTSYNTLNPDFVHLYVEKY